MHLDVLSIQLEIRVYPTNNLARGEIDAVVIPQEVRV